MRKTYKGIIFAIIVVFMMTFIMMVDTGFIAEAKTGSWKHDKKGYWYSYSDGTYAKNEWLKIKGKWYYFNKNGYMQTGWQKISGKWYYFNPSGSMQTGWRELNDKWYYFGASGAMQTGWKKIAGKWYRFEEDGSMIIGWHFDFRSEDDYDCYHFAEDGVMDTDKLIVENDKCYRIDKSGNYIWQKELKQENTLCFIPEEAHYDGNRIIVSGFYVNTHKKSKKGVEYSKVEQLTNDMRIIGYKVLKLSILDQNDNVIASTEIKGQEMDINAETAEYVVFTIDASSVYDKNADLKKCKFSSRIEGAQGVKIKVHIGD